MAEELNIQQIEVEDATRFLIGLTKKSDGSQKALTEEQYAGIVKSQYTLDGIIVRNEDADVDLLFSPTETQGAFGSGPADMPETDKRRKNAPVSPSFYELDGLRCTMWQLANHPETHEQGCAVCEAAKFGWLPSNGEIGWPLTRKEQFDQVADACGAQRLSGTLYSTSTQYDPDYMWCHNMETGNFEFWHSKATLMTVRPVKSAAGYAEVEE